MNTIIYCRVSSKDQVDGTSLESQESACRAYAARHGLSIMRVFIEQGESAKFADRTQLLELLSYCKDQTRRIEALLVWKVDRFARNIEDHYTIKATLRKMGVRVMSVTEPLDSDPNGKLLEAILAGFAQFDNDVRALRTVQGMQQRLRDGIFPWKPPLGYLPPRMGKKREADRIDPTCFHALQRAWCLFATGGYSKAAIVRLLKSWGVRATGGAPVSPQAFDHMLANPYYSGVVRDPWTGVEYPGRHTPLVTADQFASIQRLVQRHRRPESRHRAAEGFPVRGLARCPSCGWALTAAWSRGRNRRYPYYSCFQRGCPTRKRGYRAEAVHAEFSAALALMSLPRTIASAAIDALQQLTEERLRGASAARLQRQEIEEALQRQFSELIALRTNRLISDDEFTNHRAHIARQLQEVQAGGVDGALEPLTDQEASVLVGSLGDLNALWTGLPVDQRQEFGQCVFPAGYVLGQVRTAETGLLIRAFAPSREHLPNVVASTRETSNTIFAEIRKFLAIVASAKPAEKQAA